MKKTYVKPTLNLESFVLTQSIAHNCGDTLIFDYATLKYKGQCGWDPTGNKGTTGMIVFMANSICTFPTETYEGVCYNNPEGDLAIFNS